MDMYDGGRGRPSDNGTRQGSSNGYYQRGRSPSPGGRYHPNDNRRRHGHSYSPRREGHQNVQPRHEEYRGNPRWDDNRSRNEYDRRPTHGYSPHRSPRNISPSWRRNSRERSPRSRSPHRSSVAKGRNFFPRSRSRSHSRGRRKSRSRTSSRGRDYYPRRSPSPRLSTSHHSSRRSSSYSSRKRLRRNFSSSSNSGSSSSSERRPKDDFFKAMYNQEEEDSDGGGTYLHPVLDRGPKDKTENKKATQSTVQQKENVVAQNLSNTESLNALSQAYGNTSPQKNYQMGEIDDEDRFLYGEDGNEDGTFINKSRQRHAQLEPQIVKAPTPPVPAPPPPPQNPPSGVTPGGFDSNALKNVLKAIGFDFEMSAQQSQKVTTTVVPEVPPTRPVTQQASQPPAPQPIQSLPEPVPVPQMAPTKTVQQQFYEPYDPYSQVVQNPQGDIAAGLGNPITIQDPSNPTENYLVYQPVNPQAHIQAPARFTQHETSPNLTVIQPQTNLSGDSTFPQRGRVVLPPQRPDEDGTEKGNLVRQNRLDYLQLELEKLKQQQNELMRKKRREKDGHKDPLITKNNLLQAGVQEQIQEIRQAAERAAGITSDSSEDFEQEQKETLYDYFDPGNHWCQLCNTLSHDLCEFLTHLHSKTHRKTIDPYNRPWNDLEPKKKKKSKDCISKPLKGSEFLIPITGYFCTICQTFSGDQICAEDHCKTYMHNVKYKQFRKKNKSYEKQQKKKKKEAKILDSNGKMEMMEQPVEKEMKYVEKEVKKHKKHKVKKEQEVERYVEEEPKKKQKKEKRREEEVKRETFERNEKEDKGKILPKRYSDSYERPRKVEPEPRKGRWSPGYDEYERRHEEVRYRTPEKKKHSSRRRSRSRSRDEEERWVERDVIQDTDNKRKEKELSSEQRPPNLPAVNKIPTPGFGKFSWNSGSRVNPRNSAFDQVPVDMQIDSPPKREENVDDRKGKIAIKITGKSHLYPPRLGASQSGRHSNTATKSTLDKKASIANELQKKVEALKKENALRAHLSSITLPAGRAAKQYQPSPNTAAVILGTRNIGRSPALAKTKSPAAVPAPMSKIQMGKMSGPAPPSRIHVGRMSGPIHSRLKPPPQQKVEEEEEIIMKDIEAEVSPPHRRDEREPPPPGEEDETIGDGGDDGAASDASGISMEIASDEE